MCHAKNVQMAEGKEAFGEAELQSYMAQYDEIVTEGLKANPVQTYFAQGHIAGLAAK